MNRSCDGCFAAQYSIGVSFPALFALELAAGVFPNHPLLILLTISPAPMLADGCKQALNHLLAEIARPSLLQ
jgi:hypothetical protein